MKMNSYADRSNYMVQLEENNQETVNGDIDQHDDRGTHRSPLERRQDHAN